MVCAADPAAARPPLRVCSIIIEQHFSSSVDSIFLTFTHIDTGIKGKLVYVLSFCTVLSPKKRRRNNRAGVYKKTPVTAADSSRKLLQKRILIE